MNSFALLSLLFDGEHTRHVYISKCNHICLMDFVIHYFIRSRRWIEMSVRGLHCNDDSFSSYECNLIALYLNKIISVLSKSFRTLWNHFVTMFNTMLKKNREEWVQCVLLRAINIYKKMGNGYMEMQTHSYTYHNVETDNHFIETSI